VEACGVCSFCAADGGACQTLGFGDDDGTCTGARTCSSGACGTVDVDRFRGKDYLLNQFVGVAQTFTARAGSLIEIRLRNNRCSTMVLQGVTADGLPDGVKIAEATTLREERETFLFTGVHLKDGQRLAFVFEKYTCGLGTTSASDSYSGGKLFVRDADGGMDWAEQPGSAAFMTIIH
jgi:hypothetical protein